MPVPRGGSSPAQAVSSGVEALRSPAGGLPVLGSRGLVAFVATIDLDRARDFYGGVLGLPMVEESPFACVFDAHGTSLRVTPVSEIRTAPYTVLGWVVDDIGAPVRALSAAGVGLERFEGMEQD